ncbi:Gfo/Idh/MocA family oxidoreductase [bacterium]|nr:Gfo/Idh/MocA family oxidoreductase [bacterium]
MKKQARLSRRRFLGDAIGSMGAAMLAPYVITTNALGAAGIPPASERIVMANIGSGGQGRYDTQNFLNLPGVEVVAVCDVDKKMLQKGLNLVNEHYGNQDCRGYSDFREVLARSDIDAINIGTVDHWHVLIGIAACRAGKDIYCQKPLSATIAEGRAMVEAVNRYRRVLQVGTQQRSEANFRYACELVRNGRIGRLTRIDVYLPAGPTLNKTPQPQPVPPELDYEMWQGPAPAHPYCEERVHWNFRWIMDYTPGMLSDWGAHHIDIAQWGHGTELSGPVEIEGTGYFPPDSLWDAPPTFDVRYTYSDGVTLRCTTGGNPRIEFFGTEGAVKVARGNWLETTPRSLARSTIAPGEIHLYESRNHYADFIQCVRSRQQPAAPVEIGHRSVTICHLGLIACRLGRKLRWDPQREAFIGDAEADGLRSRPMRAPWTL